MPRPPRNQPPAAAAVPATVNVKDQYEKISEAIEKERDKLTAALAAVHVKPERFLTVVDQALRRNPDLLRCTPTSILKALLDAAELGLVPSGLIGQAYLVPYRNKHTGRQEAQLIPGYRGLIDLARRSGELRSIEARTVRQNDEFEVIFGTDGYVRHVPYINRTRERVEVEDPDHPGEVLSSEKDGGPYIGAYMIATLADGVKQVEWMSAAEIEAVRRRSKAATSGPWVTDWSEMGKKTVTRRGVKYLPIAIDSPLNRALALEDEAEGNATPVVRQVTSDSRRAIEGALGIGRATEDEADDEAESEAIEIEVETDESGRVRAPSADEERAIADALGLPEKCLAPSPADGEPCLKEPNHEPTPHASANEVWPSVGDGD